MRRRTVRERQRQRLILLIAFAVVVTIAIVFTVDGSLRTAVFADVIDLAHIRLIQVIAGALLVGVFAIGEIADNADKLKFVLEVLRKILGYDSETIVKREQQFTDVPDDYVRRPELEREVATGLAPSNRPTLLVLFGERDTGKTTLLHFVTPRRLSQRYRGRVIYCRGDRNSIEYEPGETNEQLRRKLRRRVLMRIIEKAEISSDAGETMETMSQAIAAHFVRMAQPWLIIIDQIDDAIFPYAELLPTILSPQNVVAIACRSAYLSQDIVRSAEQVSQLSSVQIEMRPFTEYQALELLRLEFRRRHLRLTAGVLRTLQPHLAGASPGIIQRLSDVYASHPTPTQLESAFSSDVAGNNELRAQTLTRVTVSQFSEAQFQFMVMLGMLKGDIINAQVLHGIARDPITRSLTNTDRMIQWSVERGYLVPIGRRRAPREQRTYAVTKLGQSIARQAMRMEGTDTELRTGAAVLDYFRSVESGRTQVDLSVALPGMLSIMAWAQTLPCRLPDDVVIDFSRVLRHAFYQAGQWLSGTRWLTIAMDAARQEGRPRSLGDLAAARAQLFLVRGFPHRAERDLNEADGAYVASQQHAEVALRENFGEEQVLREVIQYDQVARLGLRHLQAQTQLAMAIYDEDVSRVHTQLEQLRAAQTELARLVVSDSTAMRQMVEGIERDLRAAIVDYVQAEGDVLARQNKPEQAFALWRASRIDTRAIRRRSSGRHQHDLRALAQSWRAEAAFYRRCAERAGLITRVLWWRPRALRCLGRSLSLSAQLNSRFEEAQTLLEMARLLASGSHAAYGIDPDDAERYQRSSARAFAVRLVPRWHRLRTALRRLRVANTSVAVLGAQELQVAILLATADLALRLWRLDRGAEWIALAREATRGALSVAERLRSELPELRQRVDMLPPWLMPAAADEGRRDRMGVAI